MSVLYEQVAHITMAASQLHKRIMGRRLSNVVVEERQIPLAHHLLLQFLRLLPVDGNGGAEADIEAVVLREHVFADRCVN